MPRPSPAGAAAALARATRRLPLRRAGRAASASALVTATVFAFTAVGAAPASAAEIRPTEPCNASAPVKSVWWPQSTYVGTALVQFLGVNIAPGTTGERTETLQRLTSASTDFSANMEASASIKIFGNAVSTKVGFVVKTTKATTETETTVMKWTFGSPGYYGLYKGTRTVSGTATLFNCRQILGTWGWSNVTGFNRNVRYGTFSNLEIGTITCASPVPADSVRSIAKRQMGC